MSTAASQPAPRSRARSSGAPMRCLSGIAYSTGVERPIEALVDAGVGAPTVAALRDRGLAVYREEARSVRAMCAATLDRSFSDSAVAPGCIDAVIFANSGPWTPQDECDLFLALASCGVKASLILGLGLQSCSSCSAAIQLASTLVREERRHVLVMLLGRVPAGGSRLGLQGSTVFSDGAASCLVSAGDGDLEIVSSEVYTDMELARRIGEGQDYYTGTTGTVGQLRRLCTRVLKAAGIGRESIRMVFGTNGSAVYFALASDATDLPRERIYDADLSRFGHVHGCDSLIGLRNYLDDGHAACAGDCFMLIGWSAYVFGITILRRR